jgi:hypothetical protein
MLSRRPSGIAPDTPMTRRAAKGWVVVSDGATDGTGPLTAASPELERFLVGTAVVPAALAGVFDGGGVSSDRKPAMSGRSKGVALASGVKCRAYGVRTAA